MNDRSVCRIALATPGLLTLKVKLLGGGGQMAVLKILMQKIYRLLNSFRVNNLDNCEFVFIVKIHKIQV